MSLRPFLRCRLPARRIHQPWSALVDGDDRDSSRPRGGVVARPAPFPGLLLQSVLSSPAVGARYDGSFPRMLARQRSASRRRLSTKPARDGAAARVEDALPAYHAASSASAASSSSSAAASAAAPAAVPASASAVEAAPGGAAEEAAPGGAPAGALAKARYHGRHFVETMKQYWLGTKLLWLDVKTASGLVGRVARGYDLSRRERKQLLRTTADLIRVVPFAVFVVVPFLEFLLPVALAIFPGMLPSTFQDSTKKEEKAKATLRARLALAGFLGDALGEMRQRSSDGDGSATATELTAFVAKARTGDIESKDVTKFARTFGDELMLDNLPRAQLVNLCRYMAIAPYGTDVILRFQLRSKIRGLREDDRRIVYEGLDSLTRQELQEACADRGMRSVGLTKQQYRVQLDQWIELAANRKLPIAILIMSRAFTLDKAVAAEEETALVESEKAIAESISGLDASLVDEAVAAVASKEEAESSEVKAKKLKVLKQQNYLIEEERREAAALEVERKEAAAALEKARGAEPEEQVEELSSDAPDAHLGSDVERAFRSEAEPYAASLFGDGPGAEAYGRLAEDEAPPTKDDASEFTAKDKMEVGEVLVDMAYESALEREKEELEEVRAKISKKEKPEEVPEEFVHEPVLASDSDVVEAALAPTAKDDAAAAADEKVASSPDGGDEPPAAPAPEAEPDKKVAALEKKLASMTEKIEQEIAKVDVKLGDKLHHIDKDNDGVVDADELREAIRAIAVRQGKFADDEKAMEKFIVVALSEIDLDNDGVITVDEIEQWFEKYEEVVEDT